MSQVGAYREPLATLGESLEAWDWHSAPGGCIAAEGATFRERQWAVEFKVLAGRHKGLRLMRDSKKHRKHVLNVLVTLQAVRKIPDISIRSRLLEPYWADRRAYWEALVATDKPPGTAQLTGALKTALRDVRREIDAQRKNNVAKSKRHGFDLSRMPSSRWVQGKGGYR